MNAEYRLDPASRISEATDTLEAHAAPGVAVAAPVTPVTPVTIEVPRAPDRLDRLGRLDALGIRGLRRGMDGVAPSTVWRLSALAGRFIEVSGSRSGAALTLVFRLVLDSQRRQEPVVWIARRESIFFPPDAAHAGVDLEALPVIRTTDPLQAARTADRLLRSGAFGLVVMDMGPDAHIPLHAQTRLLGLAKKHDAALLCITEKEESRPSLGSLVSLRAQTERTQRTGDRYRCEVRILKDKRQGPGWTHGEICHGPDGLC